MKAINSPIVVSSLDESFKKIPRFFAAAAVCATLAAGSVMNVNTYQQLSASAKSSLAEQAYISVSNNSATISSRDVVTERYGELIDEAWHIIHVEYLDTVGNYSHRHWQKLRQKAHADFEAMIDRIYSSGGNATKVASARRRELDRAKDPNKIHSRVDDQRRAAAYLAIRRMTEALGDPYTVFMTPEEYRNFVRGAAARETQGIIGLGLHLRPADSLLDTRSSRPLQVAAILPDSPGEAAGLRARDVVLEVDGQSAYDLTPDEAAVLLRGPIGTRVSLRVARPNSELKGGQVGPSNAVEVWLTRRKIAVDPVASVILPTEPRVGYVRLRYINSAATAQLKLHLSRLEAKGAQGYIIDVRNNPGGVFEEGIEIARHLIGSDSSTPPSPTATVAGDPPIPDTSPPVVAYTFDSHGFTNAFPAQPSPPAPEPNRTTTGTSPARPQQGVARVGYAYGSRSQSDSTESSGDALPRRPLVVLTNHGTASASEVIAAALHENKRALLLGEGTFGKGVIQYIFQLSDASALKVTVARYETPDHHNIHHVGITPDVECATAPPFEDIGRFRHWRDECVVEGQAILQQIIRNSTRPTSWNP